jgi:hypothetical protein
MLMAEKIAAKSREDYKSDGEDEEYDYGAEC